MWARYINKNYHLSYSSTFDAAIFHHAVSYDPTLRNVDLDGKVNNKGVYRHFVIGNNTYPLHFFHVHKTLKTRNYHKVNIKCFWSIRLYNPFTQNIGLEVQFESSDEKSDTEDHIWELPVLRYHKIMVIYLYPFFMVITQFSSYIILINYCIHILTGSPG